MRFIIRLFINTAALWIAAELLPRFVFDGSLVELALVALVFGLMNALVRPVERLLTLPITIVTLGLFGLVVNGLMLLAVAVTDVLTIEGGFGTRLLAAADGAIVISVVSSIASFVLPDGR